MQAFKVLHLSSVDCDFHRGAQFRKSDGNPASNVRVHHRKTCLGNKEIKGYTCLGMRDIEGGQVGLSAYLGNKFLSCTDLPVQP